MKPAPQIHIEIRNVYGETKAYPVCADAKAFAAIAGTKTLTRNTLAGALALGYVIVEMDRNGNVSRSYGGNAGSTTLPMVA